MTEISFFTKKQCLKAIETLSIYLDEGLEDMRTLSNAIVVSPAKLQNAIEQFDVYADKGGEYYYNIIFYPHFSQKEITVILQYLGGEIFPNDGY